VRRVWLRHRLRHEDVTIVVLNWKRLARNDRLA
jgi:hypothetical protein